MAQKEFNVFTHLRLMENMHSDLLRKLIHPEGSHGKGNELLKLFFEKVLCQTFDNSQRWEVECNVLTDKNDHADIVIFSQEKGIIYLIENKINDAEGQQNQLYRYWYGLQYGSKFGKSWKNKKVQKIYYLHFCEKKYNIDSIKIPKTKKYNERRLHLLQNGIDLPNQLDEELISCISYNKEIKIFLKCALEICTDKDVRLKSIIEQYIEWIKNPE